MISLTGIPITIGRNYDTLDAGVQGDFGYGWSMDYRDVKLKVNIGANPPYSFDSYPAFQDGTRVYITLPGGRREGFTFQPYEQADDSLGITSSWHPAFVPDGGVFDQLTVPDASLTKLDDGQYVIVGGGGFITYNPADPTFGGTYTLTTPDGTKYTLDGNSDLLSSISDRNNNTLTFTDAGITSNHGVGITFTRDAQDRITSIADPSGATIAYAYDSAGDLVSITDRTGAVTQIFYDPTRPHFIATIVNSLGVTVIRTEYDSSGRLIGLFDAQGHLVQQSNDTSSLTQTTIDALGNTTTTTFDTDGDPVKIVDALGGVTVNKFDANGDLLQTKDPLGHTTTRTFDSQGNVLSETDPAGNTTYSTYNSFNELLSTTDPIGNTTPTSYDSAGNPATSTSALGSVTTYTVDASGQVTTMRDGAGGITYLGYDSAGNVVSLTNSLGATTSDTYNGEGQITRDVATSPDATQDLVTTNVYDAEGRLVSSTSPTGTTSTVYNSLGEAVSSTDEFGGVTAQAFDALASVVQTTAPDGRISRTVFDAAGDAVWSQDSHLPSQPADGTRTYYDPLGRVTRIERYSNVVINVAQASDGTWTSSFVSSDSAPFSVTTRAYDAAGNVIQATDAAGHAVSYKYDEDGRQVEADDTVNGQARETQAAYDAAGRVVKTVDALGHATQFEHDAGGDVVSTTFADGSATSATFDAQGRKVASTDQLGDTTNYKYDQQGDIADVLLPAVVNPSSGDSVRPTYQYAYDKYGNRVSIDDPLLHLTTFAFDALGNQVSETLPSISGQPDAIKTATYNSHGQLATETDYKGQITAYSYDSLGRLINKKFYASQAGYLAGAVADQTTYAYDVVESDGVHSTVTDSTGTTDTLYDAEGRVIKVTSPQGTINYKYDPATGEHIETWTANSDIKYGYDEEGRLTTVSIVEQNGIALSPPEVTTYSYDLENNRVSTQLPNGVTTTDTYDALGRLVKVVHDNALGQLLAEYDYTLRPDGTRSSATETELESDGTHSTRMFDWTYDQLGRLTEEKLTSTIPGEDYTDDYAYDLAGNRVELKATAADGTVSDTVSHYDARDELTQDVTTVSGSSTATTTNYAYDLNGSLISKITVGGDSYQYTYNVRSQLASATISRTEGTHQVQIDTTYKYDDDGIRVESDQTTTIDGGTPTTQTKLFLIDNNNPTGYSQILEQLSSAGGAPTISYVPGLVILSQTTASGAAQYLLVDGHGSTRLLGDASGAIVARFIYDAYGNLLGVSVGVLNLPATSILYTGQLFDPALLQYYLRARYYDARTGLFTARDAFPGHAADPQTLEKYLYARGDAPNFVDPSGFESLAEVGTVTSSLNNIASFARTGIDVYNRVNTFLEWIETASAIIQLAQGDLTTLISQVASKVSMTSFGSYASLFTAAGMQNALQTLVDQMPKIIAANIVPTKLAALFKAESGPRPAFIIYLPTTPGPKNLLAPIPPVKVLAKLGGLKWPVYVSFGKEGWTGMFTGLAIQGNNKAKRFDVNTQFLYAQFYHMDYVQHHTPGGTPPSPNDVHWLANGFEFHVKKGMGV